MKRVKEKKKKPFPQFRQIICPIDELSAHLTALSADGYVEWSILALKPDETHTQFGSIEGGNLSTRIELDVQKVLILAYWEEDEDDDE